MSESDSNSPPRHHRAPDYAGRQQGHGDEPTTNDVQPPGYAGQQAWSTVQQPSLDDSPRDGQQPSYAGQMSNAPGQPAPVGGQQAPTGAQLPTYAGQQQNGASQPTSDDRRLGPEQPWYVGQKQSDVAQQAPAGAQTPNYAGQQQNVASQPPPDDQQLGAKQPWHAGQQQNVVVERAPAEARLPNYAGQQQNVPSQPHPDDRQLGTQMPNYAGQLPSHAPRPPRHGGQAPSYAGQLPGNARREAYGQAPRYAQGAGYGPQAQGQHPVDTSTEDPWKPVGKVTKFYDYTYFSWPWISTPAALATWGLFVYMVMDFLGYSHQTGTLSFPGLDNLAILAVPFVVAIVLSFVAYIGWFPNDRLEIDVQGRHLFRVPPPIQYEEASFKLGFDEISALQVRQRQVVLVRRRRDHAGRGHRELKSAVIYDLVTLPSDKSILASRRAGRCRRAAAKISQLLRVPLQS